MVLLNIVILSDRIDQDPLLKDDDDLREMWGNCCSADYNVIAL